MPRGGRRASPGGAVRRCEGRLRSGAPPPPAARAPGGLSGSATHVLWARVCRCGGPALSHWLARPVGLRAVGVVGGHPRGADLPPYLGASGVKRCPFPGRSSSGAGSRGSATRVSRVRLARAWGPSTGHTACALAGRRCALWGWRKGVRRGVGCRCCEARVRSGAPPPPAVCPLGGLSASATHVLWARVSG